MNYYYAAKKRGGDAKRAKRGRPKGTASARRNGSASNVESILKSLTDLIRAQESELASLRRDNERFAALRTLMAN